MKWEYAVVSLVGKFVGTEVVVYWPNGTETKEGDNLTSVLNKMAVQGWEVVTSAGGHGVFHWTLKRAA